MAHEDIRLSVCREFIDQEFEGRIHLTHNNGDVYLTAWHVAPAEGEGNNLFIYFGEDSEWQVMEDFEVFINSTRDGKVFVCYPLEHPDDGAGMYFKVGHPREVTELFHLFVHPKSCLEPFAENGPDMRSHRLSDLFTFSVPPSGDAEWTSPDVRAGYLLTSEGRISCALDATAYEKEGKDALRNLLLVPSAEGISYLYVRELLSRDVRIGKEIREAYAQAGTREELVAKLSAIEVVLPARYYLQIRLIAEQLVMRDVLGHLVGLLVSQPGDFSTLTGYYENVAIALRKFMASQDGKLKAEKSW